MATNADLLGRGLRILLIIVIALIARVLVVRVIRRLTRATADGSVPGVLRPLLNPGHNTHAIERHTQRTTTIGSLLSSAASFVIITIAVLLILDALGINIGPLLASAGIAGIAIGFGAQNLVRDFLSGIFMLIEDQYGVGDAVDLGPATGTVTAVGLRVTTVQSADGRLWYVRNGEIARVGNASQGAAVVTIDLPLPYQADEDHAGKVALEQAQAIAASDAFNDVMVEQPSLQGLVDMTPDTVTLRLSATVRPGNQASYARAVRGAFKTAFDPNARKPGRDQVTEGDGGP